MKIEYVVFFQFGCALFVCLGAAPSAGIESYIPTFRTFPQSTGGITQLKIQKPYPYPPPAYPPPYRPPPTQYVPIPYPMYNQGGGSQVHRRIESYQTTQSNPGLRMMGYGGFMLFGFFAMMFMMFFFILMFGMISGGGNSLSSNDLLLASALGD